MRRGLFTFLSAMSLLLSVAVAAMWMRGRQTSDVVLFTTEDEALWLIINNSSSFQLVRVSNWPIIERFQRSTVTPPLSDLNYDRVPGFTSWSLLGVSATRGPWRIAKAPDGTAGWGGSI